MSRTNSAERTSTRESWQALGDIHSAEVTLGSSIILCAAIAHNTQANVYGISVYGTHFATLMPYALGFTIGPYYLLRAAKELEEGPFGRIPSWCLRIVGVGIFLLLITPFTVNTFFNWAHMIIGSTFFAVQMLFGIALAFRLSTNRWVLVATAIQLLGGLISLASLPDHGLNLMIEGEVIFQGGFCWLLEMAIKRPCANVDVASNESASTL